MTAGAILAAALLLAAAAAWQQRRVFLLQYLFFGRYPLAIAAALVVVPSAATRVAPAMTGNLFALDAVGLAVVTWLGILTSWIVMTTSILMYASVPKRYGLPFVRGAEAHAPNPLPAWLLRWRAPLFASLAVPLVAASAARSGLGPGRTALAVGAGMLAAVAMREAALAAVRARGGAGADRRSPPRGHIERAWARGYAPDPHAGATHGRAAALFAFTAVVYLSGYLLLSPSLGLGIAEWTPGLAYPLLALMVAGWALPGLSFFFDLYRVPLLLLLAAVSFVSYQSCDTDHAYRLVGQHCPTPSGRGASLSATDAYRAWATVRAPDREAVPVFVAASGGGAAASLWTATVLAGLQRDPRLGDRFADSIVAVSSVSGGGVGAMAYVGGYRDGAPPGREELDAALRAAGRSSLSATAWGWAYPDLLRAVSPLLVPVTLDRGWALERRFAQGMPGPRPTLRSWRRDVADGARPAQIFNATVTETGERFLFTPLDGPASRSGDLRGRDGSVRFFELYPGADVEVVTAARLSASFPYVSPIARPHRAEECDLAAYHLTDGGYWDGSGLVSLAELVDRLVPVLRAPAGPGRAVIVEIRAGAGGAPAPPRPRVGWLYSVAGPAITIANVRAASQAARNELEMKALLDRWSARGIEVRRVVFDSGDGGPLSWHLTAAERHHLAARLGEPANRRSADALAAALGRADRPGAAR